MAGFNTPPPLRTDTEIPRKFLLVGFGAIAQALVPLLFAHFACRPADIAILSSDTNGRELANRYGLHHDVIAVTQDNHAALLAKRLNPGDMLINLSVEVSSLALIDWCQAHDVLYIDTCVEPWAGGYETLANGETRPTTNYDLRHAALSRSRPDTPTAVIAHGANPGLVSHFVKAALHELAALRGLAAPPADWARLAQMLDVRVIHIAERDTQVTDMPQGKDEFLNTWSVDGLLAESRQPAELGWGSHEGALPTDGRTHASGSRAAIYLNRRSAEVKVKSWVPLAGEQEAYLITHHEAISIAEWLTVPGTSAERPQYRPTVHYAYAPCPAARASLNAWVAAGYPRPARRTVLRDELVEGTDQLGVLLVFPGGAFWYGSTLDLDEARRLAPYNNATTLQVAAGVLGGIVWMLAHPRAGIVEAESLDHRMILDAATPYLGHLGGTLTNWQPDGCGDLRFSSFRLGEGTHAKPRLPLHAPTEDEVLA